MHGLGNLIPIAVIAFFVIANIWKRFSTATVRREAQAAAAQPPIAPRVTGPAPAAAVPPRRRLAPPSSPNVPAAAPQPVRPQPLPVAADAFPPEAAAAFAALDLSLPDAGAQAAFAVRRRVRPAVAGALLGSRGWGPGAIVALEVLGPPVSIRSGATLGAPHAL
jgi:hypothetical protein